MNRKSPNKDSESLLIRRIKKGEEHAFEIAFLKYHTPLCQFTWKYVQSKELAREIVQEVFADVWEDRENLEPSGHLRGYLFELTRNKALDYIKHQKIVDKYISERKKQKEDVLINKPFRKSNDNEQLKEAVKEAIENLPARGRQVFELSRYEGLTYKEIANFLELSQKTVETHMRRALKKLREHLSDFVHLS